MDRILIGSGTPVGNHLAATGAFSNCFSYGDLADFQGSCHEIIAVLPEKDSGGRRNCQKLTKFFTSEKAPNAKRLIIVSSICAYPSQSLPFDEMALDANQLDASAGSPFSRLLRATERALATAAPQTIILRLPEIFGVGVTNKGLLKEVLGEDGSHINRIAIHQWYPIERLERDLIIARHLKAPSVNLVSEPLPASRLLSELFPGEVGHIAKPAHYSRIRSRHAEVFGGSGGYIMSAEAALTQLSQFVRVQKRLRRSKPGRAGVVAEASPKDPAILHRSEKASGLPALSARQSSA
jgi:hypothetical protein